MFLRPARAARARKLARASARMSCASTWPRGPVRAASWRVFPPAPAQASSSGCRIDADGFQDQLGAKVLDLDAGRPGSCAFS